MVRGLRGVVCVCDVLDDGFVVVFVVAFDGKVRSADLRLAVDARGPRHVQVH